MQYMLLYKGLYGGSIYFSSALQTPLTHTHTQTETNSQPVGSEGKGGAADDFSGNMSTQTITFVTTKFNYSLNSL